MESVHQGDMLIIDGNAANVHINPNPEVIREYNRLERDYAEQHRRRERPSRRPAAPLVAGLAGTVGTAVEVRRLQQLFRSHLSITS